MLEEVRVVERRLESVLEVWEREDSQCVRERMQFSGCRDFVFLMIVMSFFVGFVYMTVGWISLA